MPVSMRRARKMWPPTVVETQERLLLPAELYWNCIRPFAPARDRHILNKRSGSTQFYGGDRAAIDAAFLEEHGRVLGFTGPRATGEPGTPEFRVHFDDGRYDSNIAKFDTLDEEAKLESLRNARDQWDEHLTKLLCPSLRLEACLRIFDDDGHPDLPVEIPLLFPGAGAVGDVLRFHMSMNPMSIDGPVSARVWPSNHLSFWVCDWLHDVMDDAFLMIRKAKTHRTKKIVKELLSAGADVTPFFEPVLESPTAHHREYNPISALLHQGRLFRLGENFVDFMRDLAMSFEMRGEDGEIAAIEVGWLVGQLEKNKPNNHLRFDVGDRVECFMGDGPNGPMTWECGTVTEQWHDVYKYLVALDDGGDATAPSDTDDCIRYAAPDQVQNA